MSDTANMLGELTTLYEQLLGLMEARGVASANLATANSILQDAQAAKSAADSAISQHQAKLDNYIIEINRLNSEMNAHNQLRQNLDADVVNTGQVVVWKEADVATAQQGLAEAEKNVADKTAEVNALKAKIKLEVEDDFPT